MANSLIRAINFNRLDNTNGESIEDIIAKAGYGVSITSWYQQKSDAPTGLGNWYTALLVYKFTVYSGGQSSNCVYCLLFYPGKLYMGQKLSNSALEWTPIIS